MQKLYSLFEATWPGHSILLGPQVQQAATAAAWRHAQAAAAATSGLAVGTPEEQAQGQGQGQGLGVGIGQAAEAGGGAGAEGAFHSAPSVATMSTPMLLLALQPYVLKALLGLVGNKAAVFYR